MMRSTATAISIDARSDGIRGVATLHDKLDRLAEQVDYLTRRQRAWDELRQDMAPIVNDVYRTAVQELEQLDGRFDIEDVAELARKLLRNTRNLSRFLDQLASLQGLVDDVAPLGKEMFGSLVERLDGLERAGTLETLRELARVTDRFLTTLGPDGVRELGEGLEGLVAVVRKLGRPEVLQLVDGSLDVLTAPDNRAPSGLLETMRQLRDPEVRQGLGVVFGLLRQLSRPAAPEVGAGSPAALPPPTT